MPEFHADAPAQTAHTSLRRSLAEVEKAQHCAVLWFAEIQRRGLFRELGFSSMQLYATRALGFSRAKTGDFTRLAAKLEQLPKLRESVVRGEVGYTKAREVIKVATPRTEGQWVAMATESSRETLTRQVKRVRKKAAARKAGQPELLPAARVDRELPNELPQRVTLEMSPEQFARWESLWEKARKRGLRGSQVEELLEALGTLIDVSEGNQMTNAVTAPRGATPVTLHVHECPTCAKATVQTSRGERTVEATRYHCDAMIVEPGKRARSATPPKTRRQILERDRYRCQTPGCTHTHFLEIHHKRPVSAGGSNDPGNLVTLCSACHQLIHRNSRPRRCSVAQGAALQPRDRPGSSK